MLLTITLEDQEAARVLDLAWKGARFPMTTGRVVIPPAARGDKALLESFRAECESAKGGKL